jgi:hypothetical protein
MALEYGCPCVIANYSISFLRPLLASLHLIIRSNRLTATEDVSHHVQESIRTLPHL